MNYHSKFQGFLFFLLTVITTGCSNVAEHNRFLKEHGITQPERIPSDYANGSGWKELSGNYVYYLDIFETAKGKQMLYFVADKKEEKMIGMMHVNPFITPATIAQGISPATVVSNYEEINPRDLANANDMSEFNELLKGIPEMKDFAWKNKTQNQIASGILLKTHFIYVTRTATDDKLFSFSETPVMQDREQLLQEIFNNQYTMYHRDVERLNRSVELSQYIKALGFSFGTKDNISPPNVAKFYIDDLITNDPINFDGKGKMFFFTPFKSFTRIHEKGSVPNYTPAIETFEYIFKPGSDGFPVFTRNTHFASLLSANRQTTSPVSRP